MSLRAAAPLYQHRGLVLTSAPASEPVTADELRTHLGETSTALPDAGANALIAEAREEIENRTGLAFITQTWKLALDRWPSSGEAWWDGMREGAISDLYASASQRTVQIPRWPLQSITSVTVYDDAGTSTSVTVGSTFNVDLYGIPGRMTLKAGAAWPVALRATNAVEVVFVSGYTSAANVPATLKRAVRQLAAFNYAHRGDDCDPSDAFGASGAEGILRQYRPMGV